MIFYAKDAMICDGMRRFLELKIAGKCLISSQRVAGPLDVKNVINVTSTM